MKITREQLLARRLLALTLPRIPHDCVWFPGPRPQSPMRLPRGCHFQVFTAMYEHWKDQETVAAMLSRRQYSVWFWLQLCLFPFVDSNIKGFRYPFGITQYRNPHTGHGGLQGFADALGCSRGGFRDLYWSLYVDHGRYSPSAETGNPVLGRGVPPKTSWAATGRKLGQAWPSWQDPTVLRVRRWVELAEVGTDGRKIRKRVKIIDRARHRGREYPDVRAMQTPSAGQRTLWISIPETKGAPYSVQEIIDEVVALRGG